RALTGTSTSSYLTLYAWNGYVLIAIGLFGVLLYIGLLYAGVVEFIGRVAKKDSRKRRRRNTRASGF
ncbi:MAG: hypothetical protein ACLQLC_17060, partial [Candidatus Sulfotelmatobacter sp.]